MKPKRKRQYGEVDYWESMSDILVGLLLCILLIVLLLILYLLRVPDNENVDDRYGSSYATHYDPNYGGNYGEPDDHDDDDKEFDEYDPDDSNGGGGGSYGGPGHDDPGEYDDPDPGAGEGTGLDKAAIYVQVVDGETGQTIKRKGMEYELYSHDDVLQTLSVYYPQKIDYTRYNTTADGVFYLPEKIFLGSYYLHDLTLLKGYDAADKVAFTVDNSYDWADPYVVTVSLYPSRSIIRVQLKDQDTGQKLGGAAFHVIASQDIVTLDGTVRCREGQIVDTIVLDDTGYGESKMLYLGEYHLEQTTIPQTYAALDITPSVVVQKSSNGVKPSLTTLSEQKTTVQVTLVDALYQGKGLSGAVFTLTSGDGKTIQRFTTDENGRITLTDLNANTTYRLQQVNTLENYEKSTVEQLIRVDSRGYIDGKAVSDLTVTNEIVRVAIGVRDKLFHGLISDVNVALYTADGTLVKAWDSSAVEQTLEGLEPGEYRVVRNGNMDKAETILVQKTVEIQSFYFTQWTTADIGALVLLVFLLASLLALAVYLIRKKRSKEEQEKEEQEEE